MQLSRVVSTSGAVSATPKRLEKIALITTLLEQLRPEEVEVAVSFLSGSMRQGRIGIGYATLRELTGSPAAEPTLELLEVDEAFESLKITQGSGSAGRKIELLRRVFARATDEPRSS